MAARSPSGFSCAPLLLVAAVFAPGCGAADAVAPRSEAELPPRIEPVDERVPADLEAAYRALGDGVPPGLEARPDQRAFLESIAPAPDGELRVVARLRLNGPRAGVALEMVAWRSVAGDLCTLTIGRSQVSGDVGGVGPNGPCVRPDACADLCVDEGLIELGAATSSVLAGTVRAGADELRVYLRGGSRITVPLVGPRLRAFGDRRVVLFDMGRTSATRFDLARDGVVVATRESLGGAYDYATEDCMNAALAAPTENERERRRSRCI